MRVLDLRCNHCGARLDVPKNGRFLTCTFCGAELKVEESGGAAYTEVLEEIAEDLKELKRGSRIERLDREWMMKRDSFLVSRRSERGGQSSHLPTKAGSIGMGIFAVVAGLIWMGFITNKVHAPPGFAQFGWLVGRC